MKLYSFAITIGTTAAKITSSTLTGYLDSTIHVGVGKFVFQGDWNNTGIIAIGDSTVVPEAGAEKPGIGVAAGQFSPSMQLPVDQIYLHATAASQVLRGHVVYG